MATKSKTPAEHVMDMVKNVPEGAEKIFGDQKDLLENIKVFARSLSQSPISAKTMWTDTYLNLLARKHVMQYVVDRPDIAKIPIAKPFIVTGMYRTGTTLLYNLLHCDPCNRSPLLWQMLGVNGSNIVPAATAENLYTDPRIAKLAQNAQLSEFIRRTLQSHPVSLTWIEEELMILHHAGINIPAMMLLPEFRERMLQATNVQSVYRYLRVFLQFLSSSNPLPEGHRWSLKAPVHSIYLPTVFNEFPDAQVVVMHRDMEEVIGSSCRLFESIIDRTIPEGPYSKWLLGGIVMRELGEYARRLMAASEKPNPQILNIRYQDLFECPIDTVKKIYRHYNMEVSEAHIDAMNKWLQENPQGKYGRATYSLKEYGLTKSDVQLAFADYTKRFLEHDNSQRSRL